jgi:hypothetical protein
MNSRFDIRIDPLNGGYRIIPAHIAPERNYVLDVEGGAATDRAKIMQYQDWGGENQRFHFVHLDGDYYRIVVRRSMKVWSLPDNTFVSGTPVLQMTWNNRDNSVWEVALPLSSADDQLMSKDIRFIYHDSILDVRSLGSENLENIEVFNAAGEVIRQVRDIRNPDYSIRIDGDSGVYFVRAVLANGRTAGNKFIRL